MRIPALARALLLIAAVSIPVSSCATFVTTLPKVIAAIDTTVDVINAIDAFADNLFVVKPNADLQKKVAQAIGRVRLALDLGKRSLDGVDKVTKAQLEGAFADFRVAYQDLVALLAPFGLNATSGEQKARAVPGGGLTVPPAGELPLKVDGNEHAGICAGCGVKTG